MDNEIQKSEIIKILSKTEVFSDSDPGILQEIAEALIPEFYDPGQAIIHKGDPGNSMFIIAKGEVKVHDGGHILTKLGPCKSFGEYSLIDEEERSASVTATIKTIVLRLEQDDFYRLFSKDKDITRGILRMLIKQMRDRNVLEEKLAKSYIKIRKQKEEIEEQNKSILSQKQLLEEQNFDLISLNEEKNKLISIVVHGLKNPLTSSLCLTDLLITERHQMSEDHGEYADIICNSLKRMNNMINQVLDLNTIDSKKFKLKLEKLNINRVIKEVIQNFNILIRQKNLDIILNLKNLDALLNKVYLVQIIDNLLSNAIKFSPDNATITINLGEKNNKIRFEIIDEGPGIPDQEFKGLFEKYRRQSSNIHDAEQQSGLGLAIVKKYVDAMHGHVWCESISGKGAKFIIEFSKGKQY